MLLEKLNNPFSVETPEQMTASDIAELFVPFEDWYEIVEKSGHVFLHGHRGSGKSMMFRNMCPDCQMLIKKTDCFSDLNYFGIYFSIKRTSLNVPEYEFLLNDMSSAMFSEHALICYVLSNAFLTLEKSIDKMQHHLDEVFEFSVNKLAKRLKDVGLDDFTDYIGSNRQEVITKVKDYFDLMSTKPISYIRNRFVEAESAVSYNGSVFGFYDFLYPFLLDFRNCTFMPKGPIFLMIDDADNLNETQTKVLNSWVSYRTTDIVSIKISTQNNYKTMLSLNNKRIEPVHDYQEIEVSNIYTGGKKDNYIKWLAQVVNRRLSKFFLSEGVSVFSFFPEDSMQEQAIQKISHKYLTEFESKGKGYRASDDAYRYSRPDYIVGLGGISKNHSTYKYAGFNQLSHISSGIIRYFLEPASRMYSDQKSKNGEASEVLFIEPSIQNKVIRAAADELFLDYFDSLIQDAEILSKHTSTPDEALLIKKLQNLIQVIGNMFFSILSDVGRAERRVFSFAISDPENMTTDLKKVLRLGVGFGFLYEGYIGNKEGTGRNRLYVLTRRLAPFFKLDPTGFSGYQYVKAKLLIDAMDMPRSLSSKIKQDMTKTLDEYEQNGIQLSLI